MQSKLCITLALVLFLQIVAAQIVPRQAWTNIPKHRLPRLHGPARYIIIHHTASPPCYNPSQCISAVRQIQMDHRRRRFRDIGYNFLIGGDGRIYEGLGFGIRGEHAPRYNSMSIGIAFIGNYNVGMVSHQMLQAARRLIQIAEQQRQVQSKYVILGHCQTKSTVCPGRQLLNELRKWPRWQNHP